MALEPVGIDLSAEGARQYTEDVNGAYEATSGLSNIFETIAGVAGGLGLYELFNQIADAMRGVADAVVGMDSGLEKSTLQFTELMGSSDTAKQHIEDLYKFAETSPFSAASVVEASHQLETFGGKALDTMATMTMLGDAAAVSGRSIDQIAFSVGRAYTAIQAGEPFGRASLELQMMGVITGDTRVKIEALQKSGADSATIWGVLTDSIGKFSGATNLMAQTWEGLTTTIDDATQMLLGKAFQPLYDSAKSVMKVIADLVQNPAMSDWATKIAQDLLPVEAVIDIVTQYIQKIGPTAIQAGEDFTYNLTVTLSQAAQDALTWGSNITTELAQGLIDGASDALVAAMDYVGNLLLEWLGPGSPPKVAPEVDKWGTAAINQFLLGMTQGNFDTLGAIEGPIQKAIGALKLPSTAAAGLFHDLSGDMAQALSGQGDMSGVLAEITAKLGPYGAEVSKLVQDQLALAQATQAADAAQKALTADQTTASAQQVKMDAAMNEYNKLAAAGADPAVLAAKRAEFQAAKDARDAAAAKIVTDQEAVTTSKEKQAELQAETKLQGDQVNQLVQLTEQTTVADTAAAKKKATGKATGLTGLGKGAELQGGSGENIVPPAGTIANAQSSIQTALATMEANIKTSITNAFKPLTNLWDTDIKPHLDQISAKWTEWAPTFGAAWNTWVVPAFNWMITNKVEILAFLAGFYGGFKLIQALNWISMLGDMGSMVAEIWAMVAPLAIAGGLVLLFSLAIGALAVELVVWGPGIKKTWGSIFADMWTILNKALDGWKILFNTILPQIWEAIKAIVGTWAFKFGEEVAKIGPVINTKLDEIKKGAVTLIDSIFPGLGKSIVDGIIKGLKDAAGLLNDAIGGIITAGLKAGQSIGIIKSPSQLFAKEIGLPIAQGVAMGILSGMDSVAGAVSTIQTIASYGGDATAARFGVMIPSSAGASNSTAYNLTLQTQMQAATVQMGFESMRILGG